MGEHPRPIATAQRHRVFVVEVEGLAGEHRRGRPLGFEPDGVTVRQDEAEEVRRAFSSSSSGSVPQRLRWSQDRPVGQSSPSSMASSRRGTTG